MSDALHTLAYFSQNAVCSADPATEIEQILAVARVENPKREVTGALLYSDGYFAQVLEGRYEEVKAVFSAIERDPRHHNITVLYFKPAAGRNFGAWSMAYAGAPDETAVRLDIKGVLSSPGEIVGERAGEALVSVLHGLITLQDAA